MIALNIIVKMATVVANTPIFLLPAMFVVVLGFSLGRVYMKAQLSVKREMSNCKAPVLSTFGSAIQGLGEYCNLATSQSLSSSGSLYQGILRAGTFQAAAAQAGQRLYSSGPDF